MDRINSFGATLDHKFTEGNPTTGVPATVVSAKFLNDIQEEMCNFVESAGLELDADDQTQFEQAARIIAAFTPKGSFIVSEKNPRTMGVEIASGFLNDGVNLTYVAPQSTTNLTAPVTNPRYDLVVIDAKTGAYSFVTGTENASPSLPAVPAGKMPIASILLQTDSTEVVYKTMINDLRAIPQTGGPIGAETNLASASSTNLGSISGRYANITGTTTITNFGTSLATGRIYFTRFAGALTLTNGGNLATSTGANITTTAGDFAIWRATSATAVTMVAYFRADGKALVSPPAATTTVAGVSTLPVMAYATTNTQTSAGTGSWVATGLAVTIQPVSTSQLVKLDISQDTYQGAAGTTALYSLRLKRGTTVIATWTNLGTVNTANGANNTSDSIHRLNGFVYVDNPATTSPVTYSMEMISITGTVNAQYNNAGPSTIFAQTI